MEKYWKIIVPLGGGALSYLFGGWSILLQVLCMLVIADYVTGLIASGVEGKLSSKVGFKGIFKKVMLFVIVVVAHYVDVVMHTDSAIRDAACLFYISNELLSILENAGRAGVPVPDAVSKAIKVLQSKGDDKDGGTGV